MAIVHVPDSAWAKEATRWEAQGSTMGPGLRPYVKRDYPMMLHKAWQRPSGGIDILDQQIVNDESQRTRLEAEGYRPTPLEAFEALERQQAEFAKLAAEREYEKQHKLSAKARAEVALAEAEAGAQHLPTITETPIKRRGRPVKIKAQESEPA